MDWLPINSTEDRLRLRLLAKCDEWLGGTGEIIAPTITITVEELLERYVSGERNFVDICLPPQSDLSGVNLAGAILLGANLSEVNFTDANLTDCDLRYAIAYCTNFTRANLTGANIYRCTVVGAKFKNACLLNTVGDFGIQYGGLFEDTIICDGSVVSYKKLW
jgi:hypothetical protein